MTDANTAFRTFETAEQARDEAKRLSRETGDIHCAAQWEGQWIVYALGFGPATDTSEED